MVGVLKATLAFATRGDRLIQLQRIAREWVYLHGDHPPQRYLLDLMPELHGVRIDIETGIRHLFELPYSERVCVAALIKVLRPRLLFEFGTYTGMTTRLLADAAGLDAIVHTVDLPDEEFGSRPDMVAAIGREFLGNPEYARRIVLHRADSRTFDPGALTGRVDFVFVDASHERSDVLQDSRLALRLLAPGGTIVWDDYQPQMPGVVAAIQELAYTLPLVHLAQTRLIVYRSLGDQPRSKPTA